MLDMPYAEGVYSLMPRPVRDPYSNKIINMSWVDPIRTPIPGAVVITQTSSEMVDASRLSRTSYKTLSIPGHFELDPVARIEYRGEVYTQDGKLDSDVNPFTGWQPISTVALKRTEG